MRGATSPATSRAVAIHETLGSAFDFESNFTAQTTSLDDSLLGLNSGPFDARHAKLGRIRLMLRKGIRNVVPRGLGAREDVGLRFDSQVAVQVACRAEHESRIVQQDRRHRPAGLAERARPPGLRFKPGYGVLARHPPKTSERRADKCRVRSAMMFAAHRAVAIHHGCERSVYFVPDGPTQALSLVHDDLLL